MSLPWIDIGLLILVGGFTITGFAVGFVQTAANLAGTILGIALAGRFVDPVMAFLHSASGITRVIVYLVLYALLSRLVGFAFWLVRKTFGFLRHIPLVPTVNRLLGAALGLLEGLIAVGAAIFIALQFIPETTVTSALQQSTVAAWLLVLMQAFKYLLPQAMRLLNQ